MTLYCNFVPGLRTLCLIRLNISSFRHALDLDRKRILVWDTYFFPVSLKAFRAGKPLEKKSLDLLSTELYEYHLFPINLYLFPIHFRLLNHRHNHWWLEVVYTGPSCPRRILSLNSIGNNSLFYFSWYLAHSHIDSEVCAFFSLLFGETKKRIKQSWTPVHVWFRFVYWD